jgi:tRNA threonylcarbamoyladenosine biosynthesis protein TsaB
MQGLIIDTSCNRSYLILACSGNPVAFLPMDGGEGLSKSLGRTIQELIDQHPSFRANFIAIGTGPGSYTGVRVGVAMAKALAFGWEIPLLRYCSLQAFLPSQVGPFAVLIDARMGGCYCLKGRRSHDSVQFEEPFLLKSAQELAKIELLASPHPMDVQKRLAISQPVLDVQPDVSFLSSDCCRRVRESAQSPLLPLPIAYFNYTAPTHVV